MGGKTKQSQRTKNNARPSNSGRSAEILSNNMDSGIILLKTGKPLPPLFPTFINSNPELVLSPEINVCFKKFTKKDPITKTKALQELMELLKTSDINDLAATLPSWANCYPTLTFDNDHKVRETTQLCHGAIMAACGRRAAPHIKRLLPAWLLAYHDDYASAQSAARHHLHNTFPEGKLDEAILFCKSEIITLLLDNLMGNADSMLSKKVDVGEERDSGLARVLCSSMRALEWFARRVSSSNRDWLHGSLMALLKTPAWWRLASHADVRVRAAWYCAMGRIAEQFGPTLDSDMGGKLARALVAQPETSPAASADRWAALLMLMEAAPDWHIWLGKKDLLVKRLLNLLENGGWGEARLLTDILLPLIARLPSEMLTKDFYLTLFNALFIGLQTKSLLNSKSERQHWISNISQCLGYLSRQRDQYVTEVASCAHRSWFEHVSAITDNRQRQDLIKHSATNMASLLKYWLKQSKENGEKYDQLIRNCWLNIGAIIQANINKLSVDEAQIAQAVEDDTLLLITLERGFLEVEKKRLVKFETDDIQALETNNDCDQVTINRFKHNLDDLVGGVCCHYFTFAKEKQVSRAVFPPLYKLISHYDSEGLFVNLVKSLELDSIYGWYDKELRLWLSGDTMRCRTLVDIVLMAAKYISEEEQDRMFNSFQQFPPSVVEWCLSSVLLPPYTSTPAVRRWLRSSTVEASVVGLCKRDDDTARRLLIHCLSSGCEEVLSEVTISKVVELCAASLSGADADRAQLDSRLSLAQHLCCAVAGSAQRYLGAPLLVAVHGYYLTHHVSDETSSENKGRQLLRDAIAKLDSHSRQALATHALTNAHACLRQDEDELDLSKIQYIVSVCDDLLPESVEDSTEIISFGQKLLNLELPEPKTPLEVFALRTDCIHGYINCPVDDNVLIKKVIEESDKSDPEFIKENLLRSSKKSVYRAYCLSHMLSRLDACDSESWKALLNEDSLKQGIVQVVYDCLLIQRLERNYGFWQFYDALKSAKECMETLLGNIITKISKASCAESLVTYISEMAVKNGYYWSFARKLLLNILSEINEKMKHEKQEIIKDDKTESKESLMPGERPQTETGADSSMWFDNPIYKNIITGSGYFHSLQAELSQKDGNTEGRLALLLRCVAAAHVSDADLVASLTRAGPSSSIDSIIEAYYQHNHLMLFDRDLTEVEWSHVISNAAILDYLIEMLEGGGWEMSALQWDFVNISVCSFLSSMQRSAHNLGCIKVAIIARPALALALRVRAFVGGVRAEAERRRPSEHVIALPREWEDIFEPDLSCNVATLMIRLLSKADNTMTASLQALTDGIVHIMTTLKWIHIPAQLRNTELSLDSITRAASDALLRVTHHTYKLLAYFALEFIVDPLVTDDRDKLAAWSERVDEARPDIWPEILEPVRQQLQDLVEAALSAVRIGEEICHMVPFTDCHSVAIGALLLTLALHRIAARAQGDLANVYIDHFRVYYIAEDTLSMALRLLPPEAGTLALGTGTPATPSTTLLRNFSSGPHYVDGGFGNGVAEALACRAVQAALGGAGASAARMWALVEARPLQALRRLVPVAITPSLIVEQMQRLRDDAHRLPEAQIRRTTNEAVCVLEVEDHILELTIKFAGDHPLTPPTVTTSAISPVPDTLWLSLYLAHQNGTLINTMKMWVRSVTGRVESSSQCFICYCHMHPRSGHLPSVPCHQCRNRFHAACLRKWISTSGNSICPICRTRF